MPKSSKPAQGTPSRAFPDVDPARRRTMQAIRGWDTGPEMTVRRLAHGLGYRFRLRDKKLPGKPDLVFAGRRKVVFVHGCFWHRHSGCRRATTPGTRTGYWTAKFAANVERDRKSSRLLRKAGWKVLVIWECEAKNASRTAARLKRFLGPPGSESL